MQTGGGMDMRSETGTSDAEGAEERRGGDASGQTASGQTAAQRPAPVSLGKVRSLGRGLMALDMLLEADSVRVMDIAARLDLDRGACSRILQTLVEFGYAEHANARRYRRGPKIRDLAQARARPISLKARARHLLDRARDASGESTYLAILADDRVLYIDRSDSPMPLNVNHPHGTLSPLHCTALGKVFLAAGVAIYPTDLPRFTNNTITTLEALEEEVERVRNKGYAVDNEEFNAGIRCAAAPLRDKDGTTVAALGLSGPASRIGTNRLEALGSLLAGIAEDF